jgi:hypothetical protein
MSHKNRCARTTGIIEINVTLINGGCSMIEGGSK